MRYMQYIFPYVLGSDIVDRYDIWVNTVNMCDIEFFRQMAAGNSKVNLVWQPDGIVDGINSINKFYENCQDDDTVYVKIDDDIIWMQPNIIEKIVAFRFENLDAFLVSPMVINNAICTYIWQVKGHIKLDKYYPARSNEKVLWKRGAFAKELHEWYLSQMEKDASFWKQLKTDDVPVACNRFSINFILWFGRDMKLLNGNIPGDDEEYLSSVAPVKLSKYNTFDGNAVISHFAFGPQRQILDGTDILQRYGKLCEQYFAMHQPQQSVWDDVCKAKEYVSMHYDDIMKQESPYSTVNKSLGKRVKREYKQRQKLITYYFEKILGKQYHIG